MTLDAGQVDSSYLLEKMNLPVATEKRLESLGMTRGTEIRVLNNKDRGTMIVKVRGTRFAIGKDISRNIQTLPARPQTREEKAVS